MPHHFGFLVTSFVCLMFGSVSLAYETVRTPLIIAVQREGSQSIRSLVDSTFQRLLIINRNRVPEIRYFSVKELQNPEVLNGVHYLVCSATVYAALEKYGGLKAIATVKPSAAISSDHAASTAIVVKADSNHKINTLKELENKVIGISADASPDIKIHVLNELRIQGFENKQFVKFATIPAGFENLLNKFQSGEIQAAAIDPILFTHLPEKIKQQFKLLEPRIKDDYALGHTTITYPGWAFAATLNSGRNENERTEAFLKSLPPVDGMSWASEGDYRKIHQVLSFLDEPFYKSFRKKSFSEVVKENVVWVAAITAVLLCWLVLTIFSNLLIKRRTKELFEANEKRLRAEEHFHTLEKASIVSQMSNIVAHELRQPLAAISNYSLAIRRRLSKGNLDEEALSFAISRLIKESGRASDIIEHVQRYAKGKPSDGIKFNVSDLLAAICNDYVNSQRQSIVHYEGEADISFIGDPLEIELLSRNLIKNALEATSTLQAPEVLVRAEKVSNALKIIVSDNGPTLDDSELENLKEPLRSTKISGLGLGLSIVKRISERYGGHVDFIKNKPSGLSVAVLLHSNA